MITYQISGPEGDGLYRLDRLTTTKLFGFWPNKQKFFMDFFPNYAEAHVEMQKQQRIYLEPRVGVSR